MTAVDFPNTPEIGDLFTIEGITRKWDGIAWSIVPNTIAGPAGAPGNPGVVDATFPLDYDAVNKTVFVAPADSGKFLKSTGSGFEWDSAAVSISNEEASASSLYPIFTSTTSGTITSANVSQAKLFYKPSTGELSADAFKKNNGSASEFLKADGSVESIPTFANYKIGYSTQVAVNSPSLQLTATSNRYQYFTAGAGVTQTVLLPSTATLTLGHSFEITNVGSATINVQTSTGVSVASITPGTISLFVCISTASNAATSWNTEVIGFNNITGTGVAVMSSGAQMIAPDIARAGLTATREKFTVTSQPPSGGTPVNVDLLTASNYYSTGNTTANWTINFRGDASTNLSSILAVNESTTATFLATNGATPYYPSSVTITGGTVSLKWAGGSPVTAGNASSIDAYTFTILRTATSTYTVFASQARWQP